MNLKRMFPLLLLVALFTTSCTTVRVVTDYDRDANFGQYKSFAFYRPGVDKAKISDLDKRRILRAIDEELSMKGLTKSDNPDLMVSFFTKESERVDVYNNNFGWGWGWNPWWGPGWAGSTVSRTSEGTLFIDLIDTKTNQLIWQGIGQGDLITSGDIDRKEKRIKEIVHEILAKYPPDLTK